MRARLLSYLAAIVASVLLLRAAGVSESLGEFLHLGGRSARSGVFPGAAPGAGLIWHELHTRYATEVANGDGARGNGGLQAVWYGDDLIEAWRGTSRGEASAAADGIPDVWKRHYGAQYRTAAYGIAGDQSGNLLWRLRRGERQQRHTPAVTLVHIGAADLDAAFHSGGNAAALAAVPGIVSRIEASLKLLHGHKPRGRVLLLALLPRAAPGGAGADARAGVAVEDRLAWPSALAPAIRDVNERLQALADRYLGAQLWDCGPAFLVPGPRPGDRRIDGALMPDGRRPGAAGMHRLGLCLDSVIHHLVVDQPPILPDLEDEPDEPTPDDPKNLQTSISSAVAQSAAALGPDAAAGTTGDGATGGVGPNGAAAAA